MMVSTLHQYCFLRFKNVRVVTLKKSHDSFNESFGIFPQ